MPRIPITIPGISKGLDLRNPYSGEPSYLKLENFKIGDSGYLIPRGGWDPRTTSQSLGTLGKTKRWYREDGGINNLIIAETTGNGYHTIWDHEIGSKVLTSIADMTDTTDLNEPVTVEDCGSVLVIMPGFTSSRARPYSLRLKEMGDFGGLHAQSLGLDPPTIPLSAVVQHKNYSLDGLISGGLTDQFLLAGTYKYAMSYVYGTKSATGKYGESALGPQIIVQVDVGFVPGTEPYVLLLWSNPITDSGIIKAINIYRTLKDENTFYRLAQITEPGATEFVDDRRDTTIDTSVVPNTLTGLPKNFRIAKWFNNRLYGMADDGTVWVSAAGFPDIFPFYVIVGDNGYKGHGFGVIRDTLYVFKEDGIFVIVGAVPNLSYRKVDDAHCYSKGSFAELPDGFYFLGRSVEGSGVVRFDGSSSVLISGPVAPIIKNKHSFFFRKAIGKRVGDEYWLSCICTDLRYITHPFPFNNITLHYNYRYDKWFTSPVQIGDIDVWDGPGDKHEIYILEADPSHGSTGNIYKYRANAGTGPRSTYVSGVKGYQNNSIYYSKLIWGNIVNSLDPVDSLVPFEWIVETIFPARSSPLVYWYDGNLNLEDVSSAITAEPIDENTIPDSSKWDTATFDTGVNAGIYADISKVKRFNYNLTDVIRNTKALAIGYEHNLGTLGAVFEHIAMKFLYDASDENEDERSK